MSRTVLGALLLATCSIACGAGTDATLVPPYDGPRVTGGHVQPLPASSFWGDVIESYAAASAGRIYFHEDPPGATLATDPDGTATVGVALPVNGATTLSTPGGGHMSSKRHGGVYWILAMKDTGTGTNPDGTPMNCVVARRDNGGGVHEVQLTFTPPGGERIQGASWAKDDSFIGFKSVRWSGGTVTGAWYKADLAWNPATGDPALGVAYPVLDFSAGLYANSGWVNFNLMGHDWSPDGSECVYSFEGEIVRADITKSPPTLTKLATGIAPRWSPDGALIAFRDGGVFSLGGSLCIVPAAGGTVTKLVGEEEMQAPLSRIQWSPDSRFVAFTRRSPGLGVAFVPASGGPVITVIDTPLANETLLGWRPD
jgi:hypothetical protein